MIIDFFFIYFSFFYYLLFYFTLFPGSHIFIHKDQIYTVKKYYKCVKYYYKYLVSVVSLYNSGFQTLGRDRDLKKWVTRMM